MKFIQNWSFQCYHILPKWKFKKKISHFKTSTPTLGALPPRRPEQWMCRVFPCVTNKWPCQDHFLNKNIISTLWAQFPGRSEQWMCRAECSSVSLTNGIFKTIFQVKVSYKLNHICLLGDLNNECAESPIYMLHFVDAMMLCWCYIITLHYANEIMLYWCNYFTLM